MRVNLFRSQFLFRITTAQPQYETQTRYRQGNVSSTRVHDAVIQYCIPIFACTTQAAHGKPVMRFHPGHLHMLMSVYRAWLSRKKRASIHLKPSREGPQVKKHNLSYWYSSMKTTCNRYSRQRTCSTPGKLNAQAATRLLSELSEP